MNDETRKTMAAKVQPERKARHWTQEMLATRAGVSIGTISNIERGAVDPQLNVLLPVLAALGIDTGDTARATRADWSDDVQVCLDAIGLFLASLDDDQLRHQIMRDMMKWLFTRSPK